MFMSSRRTSLTRAASPGAVVRLPERRDDAVSPVAALRRLLGGILPPSTRWWVRTLVLRRQSPPPAGVGRWMSLRRLHPVRRGFGGAYGQCVDRYYIESFLERHASDIRGRVLEIQDPRYTERFGGDRVVRSDVLHVKPGNPRATIVADLTDGSDIASDCFDCIILTQTLPFIYDVAAAVRTLQRIVKPGGVVLATVPGISQIARYDMREWGDYWRFTSLSAARLFADAFGEEQVAVTAFGNVRTATAFLHGLVSGELTQEERDHRDPDYEVTIAVRAVKRRTLVLAKGDS
jgi:SAM-dependent methyltransferase